MAVRVEYGTSVCRGALGDTPKVRTSGNTWSPSRVLWVSRAGSRLRTAEVIESVKGGPDGTRPYSSGISITRATRPPTIPKTRPSSTGIASPTCVPTARKVPTTTGRPWRRTGGRPDMPSTSSTTCPGTLRHPCPSWTTRSVGVRGGWTRSTGRRLVLRRLSLPWTGDPSDPQSCPLPCGFPRTDSGPRSRRLKSRTVGDLSVSSQ